MPFVFKFIIHDFAPAGKPAPLIFMVKKMKKFRILSLFLAALILLPLGGPSVLASEAEDTGTEASASSNTTDSLEPTNPRQTFITEDGDFGVDASLALAGPQDLEVDGAAVLLLELNSNTMVYAKNIDERREPASLTKIMTCLLALEHGTLTDQITVSESALTDMDPDGSSANLIAGEVFTLDQLLYCLMIASANDAAPVIAEYVAGTQSAFLEMMNQKAKELGCEDTHFSNTHGLHADDHYTTARDLAKITLAALQYEKFQEIYATTRYELPATNLSEARTLVTTNYLISSIVTSDYYDERVVGGKTGFTTPAGRCVICVAEDAGLRYLCVVLGASNTVTETYTTYGSFVTASKMLDFGFDQFTFVQVLSPLAPIAQLPVQKGTESVVVTPKESITTMLPADYEEDQLTTSYDLLSENGLEAPLEAGETVGVVRKYYGSICVGETDLVTVTAVDRKTLVSVPEKTVQEIKQNPWRGVVIFLAVLFILVLAVTVWSALRRRKHKRRRQDSKER